MKYIIVGIDPETGKLRWDLLENKNKIPFFLKMNYAHWIEVCNYDAKELSQYVKIFEIEPNYELVEVDITKSIVFNIKLKG